MALPKKVKIGYKNYNVIISEGEIILDGRVVYGYIDYVNDNIYISGEYSETQQKATLVHEVLHGIDDMYLSGHLKEEENELLANGIYITMLDNPSLISGLLGE